MEFITGTADVLPPGMLFELAHYRHRVFVQGLGWKLPAGQRIELDEFDRRDTQYVVALDNHVRIVGTARLLSTERPYLLKDVFPDLLGGARFPHSPQIWELSRFAAVDLESTRLDPHRALASPLALQVLEAAMRLAARCGATQLISVSPPAIERILRAAGLRAQRAGPTMEVDGEMLIACLVQVDPTWRAPTSASVAPGEHVAA
ncbi:GNAT family N-acetyltransferase [Variovorax paradoxus]|nr:acyl-homoserine-lactone synthase [Variovorax paradoxus]MBT2305032.1 GNAT family N-acetyltransferase [Variovorax paradoxus]